MKKKKLNINRKQQSFSGSMATTRDDSHVWHIGQPMPKIKDSLQMETFYTYFFTHARNRRQ